MPGGQTGGGGAEGGRHGHIIGGTEQSVHVRGQLKS